MRYLFSFLALCLCGFSAAAQSACLDDVEGTNFLLMESDGHKIVVTPNPQNKKVGELFRVEISLCHLESEVTKVSAIMPAHGHGMNYRPQILSLQPGLYKAEGFLFHMPGLWEFRLETRKVETDGQSRRLRFQKKILITP